ncbi:MAG TPA: lamin tail domain-containing protein [Tepidisphaeraceae bacterium]|nr:lamin tail domain-containing protein [Tepidisphaeraceae bacterium]
MSAVDPVINEFMASNTTGILDENNLKSDWIEIYNPSSLPVDMAGWHLSDDKNLPHEFTFPSTVINPGGYLLVFASGEDRSVAGSELHADFKLDANGEYLALLRPDDTPTTVFDPFPQQLANVSYGFASSGTATTTPLATGASATYLIPTSDALNTAWTDIDFDSSSWSPATTGIGFSPAGNTPLPRETEPNNTTAGSNSAVFNFAPTTANLYQLELTGVATVNAGVINDDWFKIGKLQPGDILTIAGAGSPSSRIGGSTNLSVELWRAGAAAAVITDSDNGPGMDALINRFGIAIADTYYIRIRAQATTVVTGNYGLGAWLENSGANPLATSTSTTETEPNDTLAAANDASARWRPVQYLSRTAGVITAGDVDVYQYSLTAGDILTANIDSTSTLDARVSLVRSDGMVIASEDGTSVGPGADSSIYAFVIPTTGTYYIQVNSSGATTGAYNADIYLSAGTAPPAPTSLASLVSTDIAAPMLNINSSAYIRIPFSVADPSTIGTLLLRIKYNDGFIAYLNGVKVAQRNAPLVPAFDSAASGPRSAADSSIFESIDIAAFTSALVDTGSNILAIQGLNSSAADSTFLILPELLSIDFMPGPIQYMATSTPGKANVAGAVGAVEDTAFSVDRGFYDQPFSLTITSDTTDAQIRYTLDGSPPTATTGFVYSGPFTVGPQLYGTPGGPAKPGVITVRAAAFKTGWISTNVDTQTYIFLDQVITQDDAGLPTTWGTSGGTLKNPPGPDYAFDQNVINANIATIKNDLKSLPTVSLSMPLNDWFGAGGVGIYPSGIGVSKAMSMEYIDAATGENFQVNGGVQIVGGGEGGTSAQRWKTYKLSMRIKFKQTFGDSSLDFPLYGPDAAQTFDTLILDAQINNTWLHPTLQQQQDAMFIQDQYIADLQNALSGGPAHGPQGQFVNLYLNGLYWGIYDMHERPDEHFATEYYGGENDDWDVISHFRTNVSNGLTTATPNFDMMLNRVKADMTNPANYALVEQVLDIDDFIDYMLANFYGGNLDWSHKNWFATYNRVDPNMPGGKWRFHSWDAEHVFHNAFGGTLAPNQDVTGDNDPDSPTAIHQFLSINPEYRIRFADHMQKHFFNNGALTPQNAAAMYQARMDEVFAAMNAESARWGDNRRTPGNSYTRANWLAYQNRILNEYFPVRTGNVLTQLKNRGLFPLVGAPIFSSNGGTFAGAVLLTMTRPGATGTIYYTTDGSDPRLAGGGLNPNAIAYGGAVNLIQSTDIRARVLDGATWSALQQATFIIGPPPVVRISEFMYHPRDPQPLSPYVADDFQYIELQNTSGSAINLSGIRFTKGITFTFAPGSTLAAGARTLIVRNQAAFESRYGLGLPISGVFTGTLSDSGETIRLETGLGQEIEEFKYKDGWYPQTDGEGFSLVAIDPSASDLVLSDKDGWRPSEPLDGGPGVGDVGINPGSIVINEILSRGSTLSTDWIEFHNTTNAPIDISGWALSDASVDLTKYILQAGSIVPANGYLVLDEQTTFGVLGNPGVNVQFDFSKSGDQAYLSQRVGGNLAGYRESVDFGASDVDVPFGRYIKSTGAKDFVPMSAPSKGAANNYPKVGPIIVNEVMYHPALGGIEYVELKNVSEADVSLYDAALASGWRFTGGISWNFVNGNVIPAGGYALIVASTPGVFRTTYNVPGDVPVFGPFTGQLDNSGEKVELSKPGGPDSNTGLATWIMVDRVTYNNVAPWPVTANGGGPSLSRYLLSGYSNDLANWIASNPAPTPGAPNAIIMSGQGGVDNYYLRLGPNNTAQLYRNDPTFSGPPEFSFPRDGLDQLIIDAGGGNDSLTIDLPGGSGLPASGIIFNGDIGNDTVNILSPTSAANPLRLNVGTGINTLNFQNGQSISALNISAGGQLNLASGGKALKVNNVSIEAGATLNLADNDLIVEADAATWQSVFNSITNLVASGRNGGASRWAGQGINSAIAAANALRNTGLATIVNRMADGTPLMASFDGQVVDENSILIKYTYNGDGNLDGQLNADDYALIDAGFASHAAGYDNGDFNYSGGSPNSDDYFVIDQAFSNQGSALAPAFDPQPALSTAAAKTTSRKRTGHARHHRHHRRLPRLFPNQRFYRQV